MHKCHLFSEQHDCQVNNNPPDTWLLFCGPLHETSRNSLKAQRPLKHLLSGSCCSSNQSLTNLNVMFVCSATISHTCGAVMHIHSQIWLCIRIQLYCIKFILFFYKLQVTQCISNMRLPHVSLLDDWDFFLYTVAPLQFQVQCGGFYCDELFK